MEELWLEPVSSPFTAVSSVLSTVLARGHVMNSSSPKPSVVGRETLTHDTPTDLQTHRQSVGGGGGPRTDGRTVDASPPEVPAHAGSFNWPFPHKSTDGMG